MKTAAFAVLSAVTLSLGACASTPVGPVPLGFDPAAAQWTGWVQFTGEEFKLYPNELESRARFSQACVSGALPLDLQRQAARDLGGMEVIVTGRVVPWPQNLPGDRMTHEGSILRNECRAEVVILASSVRPN